MIVCGHSFQTGGTKGYAFVEFESEIVAKIVADTMNNYLMFQRLLKCKYTLLDKRKHICRTTHSIVHVFI